MAEQKKEIPKTAPRMYHIDSEKLMDIMRYLMTRPYGEVFSLMNQIAQLKPFNPEEKKDNGKK